MHASKHDLCKILAGGTALLQAQQANLVYVMAGVGASPRLISRVAPDVRLHANLPRDCGGCGILDHMVSIQRCICAADRVVSANQPSVLAIVLEQVQWILAYCISSLPLDRT